MIAPVATSLAPVAADVIGRQGGLFDLLKPLDYPRRAVANLGRHVGGLLSGEEGLGEAIMGSAPALIGGAAGALTGNPILAGAIMGGGLQGLGEATGLSAFNAPTSQDIAAALGMEDNPIGGALANAALDPLTYAGLFPGVRGAAAGGRAGARQAGAMGLAALPSEAALAGVEGTYTNLMREARGAATLGEAEGLMGRAQAATDYYLGQAAPGGEARFGSALQIPKQSSLQEMLGVPREQLRADFQNMLGVASDPRLASLQYNPQIQASLPDLGQPLTSTLRTGQGAAPEVMEFLERTGQAGLPPGPGGMTQIAGARPPGLVGGPGGWTRVGPEGLPPPVAPMQVGQLPPELLRPNPMPSMQDIAFGTGPSSMPGMPPELSPISRSQTVPMRANLAGVGAGGTHVMDLPLDEALRVLQLEQRATGSSLQQALAQARNLTPEQLELWKRLYPGMVPGQMPGGVPSSLLNMNPMI